MTLSRKDAILKSLHYGAALMVGGAFAPAQVLAQTFPNNPVPGSIPPFPGAHELKPLTFNPERLDGLSAKLIQSHYQNNYGGAVRRLNQLEKELKSLPDDTPPYRYGALKREELIATNSSILHELYFGNLGGNGKIKGKINDLLQSSYGSYEAWEKDFTQTALSLAGGSGWVILAYNPWHQKVRNYWAGDHSDQLAGGLPLLVLDMYEHAFNLDYGADAKAYITAFFRNIRWEEVNQRLKWPGSV